MISGTNDPIISSRQNVGFQDAQQTEGLLRNTFTGFTDGTSSLEGVWGSDPYLQDIGSPILHEVTLGLSDKINEWNHEETEYTPTQAFYDSFTENLEQLIDKHGLDEEQVNKLIMTHMTDVPADDPYINQALGELDAQVAGDLAEMFELPLTTDQAKNLKKRADSHVSALKDQISELQAYANTLPEGSEKRAIQEKINELMQNLEGFGEHLSSLSDTPSREQLAQLAKKLEITGENLKEITGNLSKQAGNNPELQSVLANFESIINNSVNSFDGLLQELYTSWEISTGNFSSQTDTFKETFLNKLSADFDTAFESELEKFAQNPTLQAQLRFAHYHPEANVPENVRSIAQQVEQNAVEQLKADGWDLPQGYTPPTSSFSYTSKMQSTAQDAFEAALQSFIGEDGQPLTSDQQNQVRNMFYGLTPANGNLGAISAELEAMVAAELATSFGLPDGFPVPKGSFFHTANVNGQFQMKFMELLNSLSPENKAQVLKAINDPLNPSISNETKALLNKLFNQAATAIRAQFSLPGSWAPPAGLLTETANMHYSKKSMVNTVSEMGNQVSLAISYVEQWPNSPSRSVLLNVLKIVSEAIANLKIQTGVMLQKDAALSRKIAQAQLDSALLKVHENLETLEEVQKKQAKMAKFGPFFKIFKVLTIMFSAVLMLAAPPPLNMILIGVLIADLSVNGLDGKKSLFSEFFKFVMDSVSTFLTEVMHFPPGLADFVGVIANTMICLALIYSGGGLIGMQMFFEHSGVIQSLFTDVFGCDPLVGEIMAMSMQMIAEVAVMIVLTAVTGGAGASLLVASVTARVAKMVGSGVKKAAQVMNLLARTMRASARAMSRFGRISRGLNRLSEKFISMSTKLQRMSTRMTKWAEDTQKLCTEVYHLSSNIKWTKSIKSAFRGGGQTGHAAFDASVSALSKQIDVMKWSFRALAGVWGTFQAATITVQVQNSVVSGQIARIRGEMESMMAELEAFIQILKKMIAKMLETLSSTGEWMAQIGQQQGTMWKESSVAIDAVAASNQAS